MTKLTFISIYPENTPGNRIHKDTAIYSDTNRANTALAEEIKLFKRLKKSSFILQESDKKEYAIYNLRHIDLPAIREDDPYLWSFIQKDIAIND